MSFQGGNGGGIVVTGPQANQVHADAGGQLTLEITNGKPGDVIRVRATGSTGDGKAYVLTGKTVTIDVPNAPGEFLQVKVVGRIPPVTLERPILSTL